MYLKGACNLQLFIKLCAFYIFVSWHGRASVNPNKCKTVDLHYMGWACTSPHDTRHILVCLFSRANKDHNKMPRTRSAEACRGLQCCTDRTAAGIMISLQRIAAGIVQTQSVRQTKILIILLSRFEKNCGTNLKCTRDLSSELCTASQVRQSEFSIIYQLYSTYHWATENNLWF